MLTEKASRAGKFEAASGSTIFLDEICNLPLGLQAKLLAVLQNREITRLGSNKRIPVDIRLIAATNRNIPEMVSLSRFREDLFYRINTIQIEIPPLRNRKEDIPVFADFFLKKYTSLYKRPGMKFHPQALETMQGYHWPGNIRELQHMIEKAVILSEKTTIRAVDLFIRPGKSSPYGETANLVDVERQVIEAGIVTGKAIILLIALWLISTLVTYLNTSNRQIQIFLHMIEDNESMLCFPENTGSEEQQRLHAAFNRIHKLMAENKRKEFDRQLYRKEYEAWDKLMHVLTHEIMNPIAPIVSLSGTLLSYFQTKLPLRLWKIYLYPSSPPK